MQIVRRDTAPTKMLDNHRPDGDPEHRTYYDTAASRVVLTTVPARSTQKTHRHERLVEVTYVIQGSLEVSEISEVGLQTAILGPGDLVSWAPGLLHGAANKSSVPAQTLTLKFPRPLDLTEADFRILAESDWHASR